MSQIAGGAGTTPEGLGGRLNCPETGFQAPSCLFCDTPHYKPLGPIKRKGGGLIRPLGLKSGLTSFALAPNSHSNRRSSVIALGRGWDIQKFGQSTPPLLQFHGSNNSLTNLVILLADYLSSDCTFLNQKSFWKIPLGWLAAGFEFQRCSVMGRGSIPLSSSRFINSGQGRPKNAETRFFGLSWIHKGRA